MHLSHTVYGEESERMPRVHLFASHGFKFRVDSISVRHFCVWLTFTFLMLVSVEIFYRDLWIVEDLIYCWFYFFEEKQIIYLTSDTLG